MTNPHDQKHAIMELDPRTRELWLTIRRALIMLLGALEDYLGLDRTLPPRRDR